MSFSRWIYLMVSLCLLGLDPTAMMMGLRHVLNTTIIYQKNGTHLRYPSLRVHQL